MARRQRGLLMISALRAASSAVEGAAEAGGWAGGLAFAFEPAALGRQAWDGDADRNRQNAEHHPHGSGVLKHGSIHRAPDREYERCLLTCFDACEFDLHVPLGGARAGRPGGAQLKMIRSLGRDDGCGQHRPPVGQHAGDANHPPITVARPVAFAVAAIGIECPGFELSCGGSRPTRCEP